MVDPLNGPRDEYVADGGFPELAGFRAQTALGADLEVEHGSPFVDKVRDVVGGLYLALPENALMLCVGDKGQM